MRLGKSTKHDLLKSVPLFSQCTKRELTELAAVCDELDVPAGHVLTRQAEEGREFMVIVKGHATVTQNGRKLNILGPGDFLGEIALLTKLPRTATVTTDEPTVVLVLTDRAFARVAKTMPTVYAKLTAALAERLHPSSV